MQDKDKASSTKAQEVSPPSPNPRAPPEPNPTAPPETIGTRPPVINTASTKLAFAKAVEAARKAHQVNQDQIAFLEAVEAARKADQDNQIVAIQLDEEKINSEKQKYNQEVHDSTNLKEATENLKIWTENSEKVKVMLSDGNNIKADTLSLHIKELDKAILALDKIDAKTFTDEEITILAELSDELSKAWAVASVAEQQARNQQTKDNSGLTDFRGWSSTLKEIEPKWESFMSKLDNAREQRERSKAMQSSNTSGQQNPNSTYNWVKRKVSPRPKATRLKGDPSEDRRKAIWYLKCVVYLILPPLIALEFTGNKNKQNNSSKGFRP